MSHHPFVYCLNTSTIRPTPLLKKIEVAARAGYEAIEPWNAEVDEYLAQGGTLLKLKQTLDDSGLKVVSMIALGDWVTTEGPAFDQAIDECRRRMEQAAALGSPTIVASPPDEVVDLKHAADRFSVLLRVAREVGITPSMEFLGFVKGIKNVDSAVTIVRNSSDPSAPIVADVFHMIRGGGSIDDLLKLRGEQLSCFHINDVPAKPDPLTQKDGDRVMVGDGMADLPRVIANLRTIGYNGPLSLELFNETLWQGDPYDVVKSGLDRIRALVEG